MLTRKEWIKCLITAMVLTLFCWALPDLVKWFKTWDWFTWGGVIEIAVTIVILGLAALYVKAQTDDRELKKKNLLDDIKRNRKL